MATVESGWLSVVAIKNICYVILTSLIQLCIVIQLRAVTVHSIAEHENHY